MQHPKDEAAVKRTLVELEERLEELARFESAMRAKARGEGSSEKLEERIARRMYGAWDDADWG